MKLSWGDGLEICTSLWKKFGFEIGMTRLENCNWMLRIYFVVG